MFKCSHTQAGEQLKNMALDPAEALESMMYFPMLISVSFDGGIINSACPFAVTARNTNYGGLDAETRSG